jgi:hypothetical protein
MPGVNVRRRGVGSPERCHATPGSRAGQAGAEIPRETGDPKPDIRDIIGRWGEGRFRGESLPLFTYLAPARDPWIIIEESLHDHHSLTAAHGGIAETR